MKKIINDIINSKDSYSTVKHIVLKGTNREIGKELGYIAHKKHNILPNESKSQLITKSQVDYLRNNYPIHYERMKGYASEYNSTLNNHSFDFSTFGKPLGETACSAVYYPPSATQEKEGILSRNLDFVVSDKPNAPFKDVCLMELHPDEGYSSFTILTMEVFGQGLEGINSQGLTVVHLADGETAEKYPDGGRGELGVGFNEFLIIQYLLDTCSNIDEAKEALLKAKHYFHSIPVHLIITDSSGDSFIWEFDEFRNREYIIDGSNEPQIITNFLISKYGSVADKLPVKNNSPGCAFNRFRRLNNEISKSYKKFTFEDVVDINSTVHFRGKLDFSSKEEQARTLMHTVYYPKRKEVNINFYLNEDSHGNQRRSEFYKFNI